MSGPKQRVWLVHGEPDHAESLRAALAERNSGSIEVAVLGSEVEF